MRSLSCPRHHAAMRRVADGMYTCPDGCRWLDDSPQEPEPEEWWVPDGVSLSYVPGTVRGGGSRSSGKSPAMQKYEAWQRREMRGGRARAIRDDPPKAKPPGK